MEANKIMDEDSTIEELMTKVKVVRCPQCENPIDIHFWDERDEGDELRCCECGYIFDEGTEPEMVIKRFL